MSKIQIELFSINTKLLLRGLRFGSDFYIFEKYEMSAFTGKNIKVIAILEIFLASCESRCRKKWILGAPEPHFQAPKINVPYHFLKIFVRALHFWIKN